MAENRYLDPTQPPAWHSDKKTAIHFADMQTDKDVINQTDRKTEKQTNLQTDKQGLRKTCTDLSTVRAATQTPKLMDKQTEKQIERDRP